MTEQVTPKAVRDGYAPRPFVFEDSHESGDLRFVAWTPDVTQLKRALYAILERFPRQVEVLFKEAIQAAEELAFHDGGSMLCVKRADTDDYVTLDEHATLFIYSSDRAYLALCEQLGFENRVNELISDAAHWQVRPAGYAEMETTFIERLNLKPVP